MLTTNLLPKWLPQISTLDKQLKILLQFFTFLSRIFYNPLSTDINMYILLTALHMFP